MSLAHFRENPLYGTGCYRRRVIVRVRPGQVVSTIDDTHHAMWVHLQHDGEAVVAVNGAITRGPATSCSASTSGLARLVGANLYDLQNDLPGALSPSANCTHLADLAMWAASAATTRPIGIEIFDIEVPDCTVDPVWIAIKRNGVLMHSWRIHGQTIVAPEALRGRTLMKGFRPWARQTFTGIELELAIMLQRGVFVARGRRYLVDSAPPLPLALAAGMKGACYSYSGSRLTSAETIVGYVRDFTDSVDVSPLPATLSQLFEDQHDPA